MLTTKRSKRKPKLTTRLFVRSENKLVRVIWSMLKHQRDYAPGDVPPGDLEHALAPVVKCL